MLADADIGESREPSKEYSWVQRIHLSSALVLINGMPALQQSEDFVRQMLCRFSAIKSGDVAKPRIAPLPRRCARERADTATE